jgi:hypothetical protein
MAPRATTQNQKNFTLTLFQPAEIVPKSSQFERKFNGETSSRFHIHSGVPQESILGPLLNVLHTSELPTSKVTTLGTFADDTAIFATHGETTIASLKFQEHLRIIEKWLKKWKIKVNECKSTHIMFNLPKGHCPAFNITEIVKYLRLHFDCRINWKEHITKK